jgi:multidrug efflux pump subunit AcrB
VLLEENARADRQVLEQIRVPSQRPGVLVPLVALADMSFGEASSSISRFDRERMAQVEADIADGYSLSDAVAAVKSLPVIQNLPPGIKFSPGGDVELQTELNAEFGVAMGNGLMAVYIVLAILFNSVLHPLTILFSLPLSVTGAMLALVVTHSAITLPVMIGILMLMGIVTKNAIMLIDFALEGIHRGMERTAALVDAGEKRARPIVMTTIAMVAGMVPSLMGWGAGGEFRSPMAITVIGGLLVSTLLSLLFVPAFYIIMDDLGWLLGRLFGRFVGKADEGPPSSHAAPGPGPAGEPQPAAAHPG